MTSNEMGNNMFKQLVEIWIEPEIQQRKEAGTLPIPFTLNSSQIIFYIDERPPEVRINNEVRGKAYLKFKPGIRKIGGDIVYENEIEEVSSVTLLNSEDLNCGHITLIKLNNEYIISFDLRYNKIQSYALIDKAKQFFEMVKTSKENGYWSSFIDNMFSAVELLARATLLSHGDPKYTKKGSHYLTHSKYNQFAHLGNVEEKYIKLFNKLMAMRTPARYEEKDPTIQIEKAELMIHTIEDMILDVEKRVKINIFE